MEHAFGDFTVRRFHASDAACLSGIYRTAVEKIAVRYYSSRQVSAWLSIAPEPAEIAEIYNKVHVALVCEKSGQPVAFADHDHAGHIRLLYCHPDHARQGIATRLLHVIEASASKAGLAHLSSDASEAALQFFRQHGFKVVRRQTHLVDGVEIHNYRVEKSLQ
jgi:putative acetyltransferase